MVIIRAIGGVLDFYMIVEDDFSDVVKQYHSLIGKTFMPPYWAYGYQLSAWGYDRNGHLLDDSPDNVLASMSDMYRYN